MRALWTAIALVVVIGIVVLVLLGPKLVTKGEPTVRKVRRIESAWVRWKATSGRECPDSLDELKPELGLRPDDRVVDPWGRPYVLACGAAAQPRCPDGFCVHSLGRDGKNGTGDDIGNWKRDVP